MLIKINFESEIPIYEQLKRQLVIGIAKGELKRGEELPSVRQLAGDIGINLHTVNKVYNILKEEGYLVIDRRKGTRIKENIDKITKSELDDLKNELEYIIGNIINKGINEEKFIQIFTDLYDEIKKGEE
ncbi:MAG: GntR family transcriptional regulator [Peptoniphilaceae bacterium]